MLLNCGAGEDSWESFGQQGHQTSKSYRKSTLIGRPDTEAEVPILWPPGERADSLEKTLMLGNIEGKGEAGNRGWDDCMASSNQWTWVWANSRGWWRTGKPGVLQSMGSHRVVRDWTTIGDWTQSPGPLPSLVVRGGIECSNPQGWLYWGPAPTSPWESKRCLISVTKDIFISFITGNSKGFRSSC